MAIPVYDGDNQSTSDSDDLPELESRNNDDSRNNESRNNDDDLRNLPIRNVLLRGGPFGFADGGRGPVHFRLNLSGQTGITNVQAGTSGISRRYMRNVAVMTVLDDKVSFYVGLWNREPLVVRSMDAEAAINLWKEVNRSDRGDHYYKFSGHDESEAVYVSSIWLSNTEVLEIDISARKLRMLFNSERCIDVEIPDGDEICMQRVHDDVFTFWRSSTIGG